MESVTIGSEAGLNESFARISSKASSLRRRSSSLSRSVPIQFVDDDLDSENVSEAGDIGDRALNSQRNSESGSIRQSFDLTLESGLALPASEENLMQSYGFSSQNSRPRNTGPSPVSPLPEEVKSPLSSDGMVSPKEKKKDEVKPFVLPTWFEYVSCLLHLAAFGILGVLTRYLLQKLFGPDVAAVTNDHYPLYLDLPSNMVGSFLMGWCGVVFKPDIVRVSDHLAIGLTTGYLGSLTTFSGWNQKMLDLSVEGHWVFCVIGFLLGLFLAAYSIKLGVGTAKCFKSFLRRLSSDWPNCRIDNFGRHLSVLVVLVLMLGLLYSVSGTLLKEEFNNNSSGAELWLACIVGPPGVWLRWFLARLNGRGLGKSESLKWIPFGTLIANVSAACIMAALAILKKAVHTQTCETISTGIQFGFLGCLSTVSTFIAEYNAMEESDKNWRAYVYALVTIVFSFALGTLIYSVPYWTLGYQ